MTNGSEVSWISWWACSRCGQTCLAAQHFQLCQTYGRTHPVESRPHVGSTEGATVNSIVIAEDCVRMEKCEACSHHLENIV